ncbi:MAG: DUF5666 domain-containing protein [Nitrospira sp.]|nr:DUF5666 domain-containing protein [Nitrospira sp.]
MKPSYDQNLLSAITLVVVLASCSPGPQAGGGIGGTGQITSIASGPITGFGSVFVSGHEYDTGQTSMIVDGKPGSQSDLKKGMIVRIKATVVEHYDTDEELQRTAKTLLYEDTVDGALESVAPDGSSLVVLGQTILMSKQTVVDASIPGENVINLMPGRDLVRISGFVTGDGIIKATFIGLKTLDIKVENSDDEVKGFIKNHKADQKTFEIGALTIDYRNAVLNDMPGQSNDIWDGLLVDVVGKQVSAGDPGSSEVRLAATLVWPEGLGTEDSADVKVEGVVTQVLDPGDFFLGNLHVLTNVGTTFQGGAPADILLGTHLEVHGPLVGGIVNATKVELEESEIKGTVTKILSPGDFFIGNLHVLTNVGTVFEGGTVNDILVGARVEVYGLSVGDGMKATKVEFEMEHHAAVASIN